MRSFIKSILIPCLTFALSALALQACSGDENTGSGRCVPNDTKTCACPGGGMGVQTCQASGSYDKCDCSTGTGGAGGTSSTSSSSSSSGGGDCHALPNTPPTCGNGTVDMGEECDDGNCVASDTCNNNCKKPYCGDGVIQPSNGETCEGEVDCSNCGIMPSTSSSSSSSGMVDPCLGKLIFAGFAAAQIGAFAYNGQNGLDAATAVCQSLGAFGMCDYEQWKQIENDPTTHAIDVTTLGTVIPSGSCQDVWLQRTTVAMDPTCPGGMSAPGPGGNCNNWNYPTNHLADGEHVNVCNMAGAITYTYNIDCDTVYDAMNPGPHQNQVLTCGAMRPIPCCYEKCISP